MGMGVSRRASARSRIGVLGCGWAALLVIAGAADQGAWARAGAASITPVTVAVTEPGIQTGLRAVKATLPRATLERHAGGPFATGRWVAASPDGTLRQVYLSGSSNPDTVTVYGLVDADGPVSLVLSYAAGGRAPAEPVFRTRFDIANARTAGADVFAQWAGARNAHLARYASSAEDGGLLRPLMRVSAHAYGGRTWLPQARRPVGPGARLNAFSLFSGEAAIQETLQRELLRDGDSGSQGPARLSDLQGPQVSSHPFDRLLETREPARLPIATLVPRDRYFVYLSDLTDALGWLDQAAQTGWELIGMSQKAYVQHALVDRYLARLHLNRALVQRLADLKIIQSVAIFGPDLYLQYGSDVTLVLDTARSSVPRPVLRVILGISKAMGAGEIQPYGADGAPAAYWGQHGRWLILSTSRDEARAALELARADGVGSLGASAEFRYMLSLLPAPDSDQGIFVYLSDPFIRNMVGPRIKIAQLRRHKARARLRLVSAAALLFRMDHGRSATLEELVRDGYVRQRWLEAWEGDEITFDANGIARSKRYGTLARMAPLGSVPIDGISEAERKAYQIYVNNYTRYWRTYFDPIGIRIRVGKPLEIETIILPLIQNSIYAAVKSTIGGAPISLDVPHHEPAPVTVISLKLPTDGILARFLRTAGNSQNVSGRPALERLVGDSVHIAIYDSQPLVALGSTELAGGFSGGWLAARGGGGITTWGILASMLTQPTAVFVETKTDIEPGELEQLVQSTFGFWQRRGPSNSELMRIGDEKAAKWVYTFNFFGAIRFHLYVQQLGDYLVISNRQTGFRLIDAPGGGPPANAAVRTRFGAIDEMARVLDLHRAQNQSVAVMKGIARLMPFLLAGAGDVEQAVARHAAVFGAQPRHPEGGRWVWHPASLRLESSTYGSPGDRHLPELGARTAVNAPSGPFAGLERLELRFGFEEDGVRAVLTVD